MCDSFIHIVCGWGHIHTQEYSGHIISQHVNERMESREVRVCIYACVWMFSFINSKCAFCFHINRFFPSARSFSSCVMCVCVLFFRVSCCVFLHFSLFRVIFSIPCSKHYFHLAWYDSIRSDFMHCSHIWLNLEQVPAFREMICTR